MASLLSLGHAVKKIVYMNNIGSRGIINEVS